MSATGITSADLWRELSLGRNVIVQQAHDCNCYCSPGVPEHHSIQAHAEGVKRCRQLIEAITQPHRWLPITARSPPTDHDMLPRLHGPKSFNVVQAVCISMLLGHCFLFLGTVEKAWQNHVCQGNRVHV